MCLNLFSNLINKYPKYTSIFESAKVLYKENKGNKHIYTLPRLLDRMNVVATPSSAKALLILEEEGVLTKFFKVESPSGGGIEDFASLQDIPEVIEDIRTGCELRVRPEHIKVFFKFDGAGC